MNCLAARLHNLIPGHIIYKLNANNSRWRTDDFRILFVMKPLKTHSVINSLLPAGQKLVGRNIDPGITDYIYITT